MSIQGTPGKTTVVTKPREEVLTCKRTEEFIQQIRQRGYGDMFFGAVLKTPKGYWIRPNPHYRKVTPSAGAIQPFTEIF